MKYKIYFRKIIFEAKQTLKINTHNLQYTIFRKLILELAKLPFFKTFFKDQLQEIP